MENKMIFDFQSALEKIIAAHSDMVEVLTKWQAMISPTAQDIQFNLSGQDPVIVPNIQKVVETLDERTLPANPAFDSVKVAGQGGAALLGNGGLSFQSGSDTRSRYTANGIESSGWTIAGDVIVNRWPLDRYWFVPKNSSYSISVQPKNWGDIEDPHGCDFFVHIPENTSFEIIFSRPGAPQRMSFAATNAPAMWHVVCFVEYRIEGRRVTAYRTKMEA